MVEVGMAVQKKYTNKGSRLGIIRWIYIQSKMRASGSVKLGEFKLNGDLATFAPLCSRFVE